MKRTSVEGTACPSCGHSARSHNELCCQRTDLMVGRGWKGCVCDWTRERIMSREVVLP